MDDKQRVALAEARTPGIGSSDPTPTQLIRYQLGNHLGSTTLELDEDAQVISYEEYSPYGTTSLSLTRDGSLPKRYRYTGMERDSETGLNYHRARYYAPWLCRWTACDPIGIRSGMNLYSYVGGNPLTRVDLNGENYGNVLQPIAALPPEVQTFLAVVMGAGEAYGAPFYYMGVHYAFEVGLLDKSVRPDLWTEMDAYARAAKPGFMRAIRSPEGFLAATLESIDAAGKEMKQGIDRGDVWQAGKAIGQLTVATGPLADALAAVNRPSLPPPEPLPAVAGQAGAVARPSAAMAPSKSLLPQPRNVLMAVAKPPSLTKSEQAELAKITKQVDDLAANAIGIAEAEGVPRSRGRFGTYAHTIFEMLIKDLNLALKQAGSDFGAHAEVFYNRLGNQTGRRARFSLGIDTQLTLGSQRVLGFDLKTGRGWTLSELRSVEKRTRTDVRQIGPWVR
jgi:RHS repeat-associated protein